MGRPRREIYSNHVYEICMRTRMGLPFVATRYMKMLLESVLSRVQRDSKVVLCHYLWMGNHPHIIVISKDQGACTQFYGEVQKQLTEGIKRLTGLRYLNLWKSNATSVIPYYDLETVCYRIGYLYANPARANLVDCIGEYPGLSSWQEYQSELSSLDVAHTRECPWVRLPFIEALPGASVTQREDTRICNDWEEKARDSHELVVHPNQWMCCFGIGDDGEIMEINRKIAQYVLGLEQEARELREKHGKGTLGPKRLVRKPLDLSYQSKKESQRISVYSVDTELRVYLIEQYHKFCDLCRECYLRWKVGDFTVIWPPGAILPPVPHTKNQFCPELSPVY